MTETASDRDFTITRVFDAPRDLVWKAWTEPEQFARWFGPRGLTTPLSTLAMDVRPGGAVELTMVSDDDGTQYPGSGVFLEVVRPERLVWRNRDDGSVVTVMLVDLGDRTELTVHVAGLGPQFNRDDAVAGWSSSFDKLAESLATV